jgi:aromatic-L-amino-acid/L-tryptophan decarboxylase
LTPEEFRIAGHRIVDWIADYRAQLSAGAYPVQSAVKPGDITKTIGSSAPESGEPIEDVFDDFAAKILPGITHWQHPSFFGYFPSNSTLASVLADMLSTGLGVIGLNWQSSPALTELETAMVQWVRDLVGLSSQWSGALQDTASTATLVALICARERATNYSGAAGGLQAAMRPLIVYTSEQAHSSVEKAAILAGFGRDHIRAIATDENFALSIPALEKALAADRARGLQPGCIIATVGTTSTTAMDPIAAIARVARREGTWMHVDAAMAGSAMILPEIRPFWDGIEAADSIVINAHKWLGAVFDCSLYFVRDPQHLIRVMSTNPSYLRSAVDGEVINYRDWGIPLGRRFRALKLWFLLRAEGAERLRARLRRDLENAQWLAAAVRRTADWRLIAPVKLQTVCVRHEPPGLDGDALDAHTQAWSARINNSGLAFVTPARIGGRWMVRVSIGAILTERAHVEALWDAVQRAVRGEL